MKDHLGLAPAPCFLSLCFRNGLIVGFFFFHVDAPMSGTQNVTLQLDGPCLKGAERCQLQFKNLNFRIYLQLPPGGKHFPPSWAC